MAKHIRRWPKFLLVGIAIFPWSIFLGVHVLQQQLLSLETIKIIGLAMFIWFNVSFVFALTLWPALARGLRNEKDEHS